ncbi:(-)-alpha-terpineol synthase-like [Camellia sinensis]|uniref:(-)-alpha-terpineol synthase-like n=1 Tax=Camellia sinensis TaxID=4442 RepID=UPI001035850F|nr:(-)-alpha-terpineol synthase-like [Camellia sinensis]
MGTRINILATCVDDVYDAYVPWISSNFSPMPLTVARFMSMLHERSKWSYSGYMPTLEEYLDHAWTSSSIPTLLTHAYFLSTNAITNEELECIEKCDYMIKWSSMVARLADDLGTSWDEVKQGDIPISIQIYMHEIGVSTEDAKEHINYLISKAWKKINEACVVDSPINDTFVEIVTNMARVSQFMHQHGDGHGHDIGGKNKERVTLLLIEPIPLK